MTAFESKLDKALGIVSEDNDISTDRKDPKAVELEGDKKKSAAGAHRPDAPVDHTEFEAEDEFQNNPHKQSDQARPDL
jgi:hypothetical protein